MSPLAIAFIVFIVIMAGAWLGLSLRGMLPEHHLAEDSIGVVKLGSGLIATLAALVLGLLIASAKGYYDKVGDEVVQGAAKVVQLDRALAQFGPETKPVRDALRNAFATGTKQIFSGQASIRSALDERAKQLRFEQLQQKIRDLQPRDDNQRALQSRALSLSYDLEEMRWLAIEQGEGALSLPLLVVLVLWLAVIFTGFGIVSAKNATVLIVFALSALSVAAAIYLIEEMDTPFAGLMRLSSAPVDNALAHLGE